MRLVLVQTAGRLAGIPQITGAHQGSIASEIEGPFQVQGRGRVIQSAYLEIVTPRYALYREGRRPVQPAPEELTAI